MNVVYIVNMTFGVETLIGRLSTLPRLSTETGENAARVTVTSQTGSCVYMVHVRRGVTTTTLPAVLSELRRVQGDGDRPLLLSPYLTPAVTQALLAEHVEFADGAGNLFLDSPAAYVLVLGNKLDRTPRPSGLTAADLKLIYALLSRPALRRATQRELGAAAGVSLGKVSATLRQLEAAGHLYRVKSGALHLYEPAQLLGRWEFGYLEQLRPALAPSGLRLGKQATLESTLAQAVNLPGVLVGGEVAADAFTRYLKPAGLTLHVPPGRAKPVAVGLRLPPTDRDADVTLLERFVPPAGLEDPRALDRFQGENPRNLAHPILVRAELLAHGDGRLRKVADRLLDGVILPELAATNA